MIDIDVTFGTHGSHSFTYQLYMTDGKKALRWLFDPKELKYQLQRVVKYGLKHLKQGKSNAMPKKMHG